MHHYVTYVPPAAANTNSSKPDRPLRHARLQLAQPAPKDERVTVSSSAPCAFAALLNSGSPASSLSPCCLSTSGSAQCGSRPGAPIAIAKDCRARRKMLTQGQGARLQSAGRGRRMGEGGGEKGNGGRAGEGWDSRLDRRDLDRYIMHGSGHLCPCPSCATFLSLAEYAFFSNKPTLPAPDLSTSVNHCGAERSACLRAFTKF